jgi:tetratricopeptide (TPR) repeat protein
MEHRIGLIGALLAASLLLAGCTGDPAASPSNSPAPTQTTAGISIDDLLQLGIASAQAGDVEQAEATFKNVLAIDPGNALANYNLGVLAQQQGDNEAALVYYDAALETDPNFTSAMYNKAIILEETDADAAIELYEQIVSINDQASTAYFRLSLLLEAQGDTAGAQQARDAALAIDPSLADAETNVDAE